MNFVTVPNDSNDSDLALLARWRAREGRAASELFRRYQGPLRRFFATKARPAEIEDLLQQVWAGLSEAQSRETAPELRSSVRAYIYGIARHVLFRHIRRRYRHELVDPLDRSIAALEPSLSQRLGDSLEAQRMMQALQSLPVDTQLLLELRYFNTLSTAELASLYEVPTGTIKSRLSHARKLLEAAMRTS
jgi:RNA polymerase sigma-70 factor (ECF subfamily)